MPDSEESPFGVSKNRHLTEIAANIAAYFSQALRSPAKAIDARRVVLIVSVWLMGFGVLWGQNTITTTSVSNQLICQGARITVYFTSSGTFNAGNVYTAQLSDQSGNFLTPTSIGSISSSSSGSLQFITDSIITSIGSTNYRVRVISSNPVSITIESYGPITIFSSIEANPAITNVACYGGNTGIIDLTPTGGTAPYSYLWTAGSGGSIPIGQADDQDLIGIPQGTYNVTITDINGCELQALGINVTQPLAALAAGISSQSPTCFGLSTGTVEISATGGTSPYEYSLNGSPYQASGSFTGLAAGNYTATVIDINDCTENVTVTITSLPELNPGSINTTEVTYCTGYNIDIGGTALPYSPATGGLTPYTYTWQESIGCTGTWTDIPNSNNSSYDPDIQLTQTTCFRRAVIDACGRTVYSGIKRINITPDPVVTISGAGTYCAGDNVTLRPTITGGAGSYTYQWSSSPSGTDPWTVVSSNENYNPSTLTPGTIYFRIVAESNIPSCNQAIAIVPVTVNPVPVATATPPNQSVCSGNATAINLTSSVPGTTFSWTVTETNATGATAANGSMISQTLSATGNTPGTVTYTVTPTANGCTGNPVNITITVNPVPTVTPAPLSQTICSGTATSISLLSNVAGTTFTWTVSQSGVTGAAPGSGTQITQTISTSGANPGTATYTVTPSANGCLGNAVNVPVTVNPLLPTSVSITSSTGNNICQGAVVTFTATHVNGGSTPAYQWYVGSTPIATGPTFTTSALTNGNQVRVEMTSGAVCPSPAVATSNLITMAVNPTLIPSVTIFESENNICPGTSVTFYAIPENGGNNPSYQWFVNSTPAGTNSDTFTSSTIVNGDEVSVLLTSNATCANPVAFNSNERTIIVRPGPPEPPGTISGPVNPCPEETNLVYSIIPVTGADPDGYFWTVPIGWTFTGQGTTTITVSAGNYGQSGNITVSASTFCGASITSSLSVMVRPGIPATPGAITGNPAVCPTTMGITYTIATVDFATTYNWSIPAGWTIESGQGSETITVRSGASEQNGNITVTAGNDCGISAERALAVTVNSISIAPTGINVSNNNTCFGTSKTLTVQGGQTGTGGEWHWYTGSCGGTLVGTGPVIVVNPAAGTTTTYYVRAEGICNTTDCASGQVIVLPAAPVQPDVIAGISPVCPGTTGLNYSISIVNDAIDYVWSVPGGWTITAGHVTNSITVTAGSSGQNGNISVTAQNTCGTSAPSLLPVIVSPGVPATPGLITGGTNQCINRTGLNYSISAVPGADRKSVV